MLDRSSLLKTVLIAAAQAPGNRDRFLQAGLLSANCQLVADWQAAFSRLQPLAKSTLRAHPGDFLAQADDVVFRGRTSGTQSDSYTYFANASWNQARIAARQRGLSWWGIDPAIPMLNLASRLSPVRLQDASLVGPVDSTFLTALVQALESGPVVLRGYPSRLCEVATALQQSQRLFSADQVTAVIATGECLFEYQRSLLTTTFCAPIINEYGCQESGISGMSCPEADRLHLDGDRALYEIINGELLTTDLYNTVMPLVRYRSGDRLQLFTEECTCGRPGPTARVLGRQAEAIVIDGKPVWPGELDSPAFAGVLNYQIQLNGNGCRLWVQPAKQMVTEDFTPLRHWIEETLKIENTEVLLEPFGDALAKTDISLIAPNSASWIQQVTTGAWATWLNNPPPLGNVQPIAALLKALVAPRYIALKELPVQTLTLISLLTKSAAYSDLGVEAIKIRVLLWATALMTGSNLNVKKQYLNLLERFKHWGNRQTPADLAQFSALGFDLLAPLLTLDRQTARNLWPTVQKSIQHYWPQGLATDAFTMHHYLAVLDRAGQHAQRQPHPWVPALKPLSAILLGDLYRFSTTLSLKTVALWVEIVHCAPGEFVQVETAETFGSVWIAARQALLKQDKISTAQQLSILFNLASSGDQLAQCWLEQSYADLLFQKPLDPMQWAEILREQIGLLPQPTSKPSALAANPMPWVPLLSALAPKFTQIGRPDLAYACLFAAAPPSRQISNFERQAQGVNSKQSVIGLT
jgi:phenylacetate-CoA ligase